MQLSMLIYSAHDFVIREFSKKERSLLQKCVWDSSTLEYIHHNM